MNKKEFWNKYDILEKKFHENYSELENLVKSQLQDNGLTFFENSRCYVLGQFEATLPEFCKACENNIHNLNIGMLLYLLYSYLHLNSLNNVKRISNIIREKELCKKFPNLLNGIDNFMPSEDYFQGRYIIAKYDKKIDNLGKYLISDLNKVENFILEKWENSLQNRIFVNIINGVGPSPFNSLLYEIYFKVAYLDCSEFSRDYFSGGVIHEITHFIIRNFLNFPIQKKEFSSFKFLEEGYAEWKRTEYLEKHLEYKIYTDNCAYHVLGSNLIELSDLKSKWLNVTSEFIKFPILESATSFTYFLEDKFGYKKINNLWESISNYPAVKSFNDYLNLYLGKKLLNLMKEWKNTLIQNIGNKESISEEIITLFELEYSDENKMIFHYKSNYPLWAGHNIFIYDDKMELQFIEKEKQYRFLKDDQLKIRSVNSDSFLVFVFFFQYSQKFVFMPEENKMYDFFS